MAFCLRTFVDVAVKLQDAPWIPGPLSRDTVYEQQIEALKEGVEFWREVPDEPTSGSPWGSMFGKTKKETKALLKKGGKLTALVRKATSSGFSGIGSAAPLPPSALSVAMFGETYEQWYVLAEDVRVTCVPRDSDPVKEHFPWLPEIDWEPE